MSLHQQPQEMLATQRLPLDPMASSHRYTSSHHGQPTIYAIPAPRNYGRNGDQRAEGLSYAEHELLRSRKTPYGRINEECELTSLDSGIQAPASKHVLLSFVPPTPDASDQYSASQYGTGGQVQEAAYTGDRYPRGRLTNSQFVPPVADIPRQPWEFVGGVDSALHQTISLQDQKFYYHPGSQIPTALPATLHAYLGPTASASHQYIGPYWPDGTFSPYRPAPIRDTRFFDHGPGFASVNVDGSQSLRRPGRLPIRRDANYPVQDHMITHHRKPAHMYLPFSDRMYPPVDREIDLYRIHADNANFQGYGAEIQFPDTQPFDLRSSNAQYDALRPGEASERIAFRDRTFSWAHQVYVELLTKIQRDNRMAKPAPSSNGQSKLLIKPAIFPKPPQRSGSYFKDLTRSPQKSTSDRENTGHDAWLPHEDRNHKRARTAIVFPPIRGTTGQSDHLNQILPQAFRTIPPDNRQQVIPTSVQRISDYDIHRLPKQQALTSQSPAAMSALETMELLCDEADSPWTDGMLLAGCLAYGLGNYSKALAWYQKILNQDPEHVEAMSNLAATLLALGRRDEALQNWSTAVRLRPSYFEAVEHLIGLLCTVQKAREAVELIEYVQSCLRLSISGDLAPRNDILSDGESDNQSRSSSVTTVTSNEQGTFDYDVGRRISDGSVNANQQAEGYGSSGYAIPGSDNGRFLALIHAKGNMLYSLGEYTGAAASFEDAILIATGHMHGGIRGLIRRILYSCVSHVDQFPPTILDHECKDPILLSPERAQQTVQRMFPPTGELPGLQFVQKGLSHKAAISTTSNSLLSLAKIYQDGMGNNSTKLNRRANGTREILALYYMSLSLQRSPSTANNVGILLASVQQTTNIQVVPQCANNHIINYAGIVPGSGIALALQYYNYGLNIDAKHAHLYTNLGSLLKDLGQLNSAIKMYEIAVQCDGNFDIALANLANAVKDQGRITEAITYYRRAVQANPDFAEAVCGLATALNSVCNWFGRGGVFAEGGQRDRLHVDENGKIQDARKGCGWMNRVVEIVDKQLRDGEYWGLGILTPNVIEQLCQQLSASKTHLPGEAQHRFYSRVRNALREWSGKRWEGSRVVRLIERATREIGWQWYQDRYRAGKEYSPRRYARPTLPTSLSSPTAPTVLPFHTFTTPLSAKQVRHISQRNALRISCSALRSLWLPPTVYPPPPPPAPCLHVGYVSSDFNNHPLAHLMQSIFGLHDPSRVRAFCYATTSSDGSIHRQQIERESPVFRDASTWNVEKLVDQIVKDGIHILVNLNGYTRGARNEVFAARPAPIHMSFMGFAGTLGAEWCDYVFADPISVLPQTLSPWRRNVNTQDCLHPDALVEDEENWMYAENVIFARSTFFCVDHKQSAPDAGTGPPASQDRPGRDAAWRAEQDRRWRLRRDLFPTLSDSAVVLGNFNQLYKIDPATFRMYLRILAHVPNAILWLLRFPDVGEQNLKSFAREWGGEEVASRVVFTDVAPKGTHITRASIVDLFLDTPECNAHTTAADVLWSGTPMVTWARWEYKMCSRMASSILASALPEGPYGDEAREELLVNSDEQYEKQAVALASGLRYSGVGNSAGRGRGRLMDLRRMLWEGRWTSRLFDTERWVKDIENAYWEAWKKWERGDGGDIWL